MLEYPLHEARFQNARDRSESVSYSPEAHKIHYQTRIIIVYIRQKYTYNTVGQCQCFPVCCDTLFILSLSLIKRLGPSIRFACSGRHERQLLLWKFAASRKEGFLGEMFISFYPAMPVNIYICTKEKLWIVNL